MKTCIGCGRSKHENQYPVSRIATGAVLYKARCRPCTTARLHVLAKKRAAVVKTPPVFAIGMAWRQVVV